VTVTYELIKWWWWWWWWWWWLTSASGDKGLF